MLKVAVPVLQSTSTIVVPESTAASVFVPLVKSSTTVSVTPPSGSAVTTLPFASCTSTTTAGLIASRTMVLLGWTAKRSRAAAPAMNSTASWSSSTTLSATGSTVAVILLASATVETSVPVVTPSPSVLSAGWVRVLPLPVAANSTAWPEIGLPRLSRTATVMVAISIPSATTVSGLTVTLESDGLTTPGVMLNAALVSGVRELAVAVNV